MAKRSWFEVDKKGLAELQAGKPKHYILRELIQNSWDENTKMCSVELSRDRGIVTAIVSDDSPEGFRDLRDAFTLFKDTYKRGDPAKRGRFNLGEKQAIAQCSYAEIRTTKGSVVFDERGRHHKPSEKTEAGSVVEVCFRASDEEYEAILSMLKRYLPPKEMFYKINGDAVDYIEPLKGVEAILTTEISENGMFKRTARKTRMNIHDPYGGVAVLYEMGLPVCEITCKYSVDVQQKVPLGIDRETVPESYLRDLYAEVLNAMIAEIQPGESSEEWIRMSAGDSRTNADTTKKLISKRYGNKVVVANPFDHNSIDAATAHGYRVVSGSELSRDEWEKVKEADAMPSSSALFGSVVVGSETVDDPSDDMLCTARLAKKIARRVLGIDITVAFVNSKATCGAQYGLDTLTFNVSRLGWGFFSPPVSARTIDLIIHELAHVNGMHTEAGYHEMLTRLAGELVMIALKEPEFFDMER